ncbi:carbon storage regulator [Virgibacillus pantothenticus]|uniref:Translational regulator CsrA n=1 Tax=Virgibacillus pantothenticus TaxID=1473 RepID=A0A0L0QMD9_VIRPA|nr:MULTISPECIES: carbon storage regulator CsrA [Virgibacillus]API93450.1 carbon storage regulator [Virgibacillus sp. 6R]KNE19767.1 carbon storage regulator [Virgibacillus pantothenticus]MBS7430174.1 carbon storage regulator CsrA [Virgibacillus sp. 19R1-5]MBU8566268.1 carbon storage regulator CsrA [Virgibacillus pantothenticus]MBU8600693.1 carbon storage regulator CsrA [Virgibacillus pantothenticus]
MLVLTRKRSEAIQIGEDIEVKVLGIEGDQVKIGISAPSSVDIYRKEIYLDIMHENNQAANIPNELVNLLKKT